MPSQDAGRWNIRYRQDRYRSFNRPRPFLVQNSALLPRQGLALDIAMGLGGNAGYLLERGLNVVGVDIADEAVRQAKARLPGLMAVIADLTQFFLPPDSFDLILNFYYLQRDLWPSFRRALRPGGLIIIETLSEDMLALQPDIDPHYLLAPGELLRAFQDYEAVVYHEGWQTSSQGHPRATAGLIARLPS